MSIPLIYDPTKITNNLKNILLISNLVKDYNIFVNSANSETFPIVFSDYSSHNINDVIELFTKLKIKSPYLSRIGVVFESRLASSKTLDNCKTLLFIPKLIKQFNITNIDFLACDTLNDPNWLAYYNLLQKETGVIVGASNDKTGNIKYGGDWVMESTGEDIETIYFNVNIMYYKYLLDTSNLIYPSGLATDNNYIYVLTKGGFSNLSNIIYKINLDGSINNSLWYVDNSPIRLKDPFYIVTNENYLYASNSANGTVSKINLVDGTMNNMNWVSGFTSLLGIVIYNSYMYVADSTTGYIGKIIMSDGSIVNMNWVNVGIGCTGITIYNDVMYVANGNGTIVTVNMNNGTILNNNWVTGLGNLRGINTKNNYLYVSDITNYSIIQININDGNINNLKYNGLTNNYHDLLILNNIMYGSNYTGGSIDNINLPDVTCFKEGTKILTENGYVVIEDLKKGDMIKTLNHNYLKIDTIAHSVHNNNSNNKINDKLYRLPKENYPELLEDLVITGGHSILIDKITREQIEATLKIVDSVYMTDGKIRLLACVDKRAKEYEVNGNNTIYHIALENDSDITNYGIYANGLLVESCSKQDIMKM
jgi:hypothetical protein